MRKNNDMKPTIYDKMSHANFWYVIRHFVIKLGHTMGSEVIIICIIIEVWGDSYGPVI